MELKDSGLNIIVLESGDKNYNNDTQALYSGTCSSDIYHPLDISRIRYFGGTTNVWAGSCVPLSPIDFRKREWVSHSGWPFDKAELDPYYEKANQYCELPEARYDLEYWASRAGVKSAIDSSNSVHTVVNQHSPTVFSAKYGDKLISAQNVRIVLNANLTQIIESQPIGEIKGFVFKVLGGVQGVVQSRYYILATGGLEVSRILLSSNAVSANGIGNEFDMLGRFYMDHPVVKTAYVFPHRASQQAFSHLSASVGQHHISTSLELTEQALRQQRLLNARLSLVPQSKYLVSEGIESAHHLLRAFKDKGEVDSYLEHVANILADLDMVAEAIARKKFDVELFDDARDFGGYLVDAMIDQPPRSSNRITLSDEKDDLGMRKMHLIWELSDQDKANIIEVSKVLARYVAGSGKASIRTLVGEADETGRVFNELLNFGDHHMGGTRMSLSPRDGVVDENLRVHYRANLFVASSSVFPTGGHVPPTLTVVALAVRLAEHITKLERRS
jgi:choline dehydrogenase-like flavoprotein